MTSGEGSVLVEAAGAGSPETELYTRSAILSWANEVLRASYGAFSEVPAKELALLLYAVLHDQPECACVTLHSIDFSAIPTPIAKLRNAQHVLVMLQQLSDSAARTEETGVAALHLSPQLTATAWLEGRAFVDELRVWRWLRTRAHTLHVCALDLQARIHAFLHPDTPCAPDAAVGVKRRTRDSQDDATAGQAESMRRPVRKEGQVQHTPSAPCPACGDEAVAVAVSDATMGDEAEQSRTLAAAKVTLQAALSIARTAAAEATAIEDGTEMENKENVPSDTLLASTLADQLRPVSSATMVGCKRCPVLVAHALQSNLNLIDELERVRRRAIAACLKKDAIELLRVLSSFP